MKSLVLTILLACVALLLFQGCGKKAPPVLPDKSCFIQLTMEQILSR
ncbi:MAG: hypothetical protein JRJ23_00695 [Deltaproteobacteria bacterium]|nr:hypothetical protein [Deltaproteobacteria bacterium]